MDHVAFEGTMPAAINAPHHLEEDPVNEVKYRILLSAGMRCSLFQGVASGTVIMTCAFMPPIG